MKGEFMKTEAEILDRIREIQDSYADNEKLYDDGYIGYEELVSMDEQCDREIQTLLWVIGRESEFADFRK